MAPTTSATAPPRRPRVRLNRPFPLYHAFRKLTLAWLNLGSMHRELYLRWRPRAAGSQADQPPASRPDATHQTDATLMSAP
jgi:hypothetical protein